MTIDLHEYEPSPEADALLAQWWSRLAQVGELAQTLGPGAVALSEFFAQMRRPDTKLIYATDEAGVLRLAFKLNTILASAFVVLWLDPEWRAQRAVLRTVGVLYRAALREFPTLLGVTAQEALLAEHVKWGYTVVGRIPCLYGPDADGWLVALTEEGFLASKGAAVIAAAEQHAHV